MTWSELGDEAVCSPALCGEGTVKWEVSGQLMAMLASELIITVICQQDGECYKLGEQGPCDPGQYLSVSPGSVEPLCVLPKVSFSRNQILFDLIEIFRSRECLT